MVSDSSRNGIEQIDAPAIRESVDRKTYWRCDHCGHVEPRYGNSKGVKFCEPCEWRYGVLDPMTPVRTVEADRDV